MQQQKKYAYGFLLIGMSYTLLNGEWVFFVLSVILGSICYFAK